MKIIDTHSHYNLQQFDEDREAAIVRMKEAQVGTICVGVD
jgi:Tat protein secretion system quality control protein TatD with DNase activity